MAEYKLDLTRYKKITIDPLNSYFFHELMAIYAGKSFEYLKGISEEYGEMYFLIAKGSNSFVMPQDPRFIINDRDYYIYKDVVEHLENALTQLKEHLNK